MAIERFVKYFSKKLVSHFYIVFLFVHHWVLYKWTQQILKQQNLNIMMNVRTEYDPIRQGPQGSNPDAEYDPAMH